MVRYRSNDNFSVGHAIDEAVWKTMKHDPPSPLQVRLSVFGESNRTLHATLHLADEVEPELITNTAVPLDGLDELLVRLVKERYRRHVNNRRAAAKTSLAGIPFVRPAS